jgi:hypothetical protein
MIEGAAPGVKSKVSTKFTERIAKHSGGWGLVKELNCSIAEV